MGGAGQENNSVKIPNAVTSLFVPVVSLCMLAFLNSCAPFYTSMLVDNLVPATPDNKEPEQSCCKMGQVEVENNKAKTEARPIQKSQRGRAKKTHRKRPTNSKFCRKNIKK